MFLEVTDLQKRKEFWIQSLPGYSLDMDTGACWRFSKDGAWLVHVERSTLKPNEHITISFVAPGESVNDPWFHNAYVVLDYEDGNEESPELKAIISALNNPEKLPLCLGLNESMDNFIGFYMKAMNLDDDFEAKKEEYQEFLQDEWEKSENPEVVDSEIISHREEPFKKLSIEDLDGHKIS